MNEQQFIEKLFARAQAVGLTEYEAYFRRGDSFRVTVFQGELDGYDVNTSVGLSFRALCGGRMGYAYTEAFDDAAIDMLVERVIGNAGVIENDDPQFIFAGSPKYQTVDSFSPATDACTAGEKIAMVRAMEEAAKAVDPRIKSVQYCTVMQGGGTVRLTNSKGLDLSHRSNVIGAYLMAVAEGTDGKVSTAFKAKLATAPTGLDPAAIGREAAQRALERQGAVCVPSGTYNIALQNEVAIDFLETFAGVFSAEEAQKGKSQLAGQEGKAIAASCVSIVDDPLLPDGFGSAPFDDEGVATYTKSVVEDGVLTTLLHNLKTAAKAGVQSTGNASKAGLSGSVRVSPSNFFVKPGTLGFHDLLAKLGDGLLITELDGLHAGANPISGDFSLSARGFRVEGGKKTVPVEQITLAGNFYTLLKAIDTVGSDLEFGFPGAGVIGCPTLLIKGLSVAGE